MKPLIIFDTDMDTDCDDVGAIAMLLEAHKQGIVELLAIISDSVCSYAAPCCDVISRFYDVNVPVGAIYADDYCDNEFDIKRFRDYRAHTTKCANDGRGYNRTFSEKTGKTDVDYPSAVSVYRQILSRAEDNSITVLCVGMLTAISETLSSKPDNISGLTGTELFKKKVNKVITMGNPDKINDFNWGMDAVATENFFSLCQVPVYISSDGDNIITGEMLTKMLDNGHLLRQAYEKWLKKENCGRSSWDLVASLYAINPNTGYIRCTDRGTCSFVASEKKLYTAKTENQLCKTIHVNCSDDKMSEVLNKCMLGDFTDI